MLRIERDKLLVTAVLIVLISIDMINTSMLAPVLPSVPNFVPFFGDFVTSCTFFLYSPLFFKLFNFCATSYFCRIYGLL